jgi:hypothetical protein
MFPSAVIFTTPPGVRFPGEVHIVKFPLLTTAAPYSYVKTYLPFLLVRDAPSASVSPLFKVSLLDELAGAYVWAAKAPAPAAALVAPPTAVVPPAPVPAPPPAAVVPPASAIAACGDPTASTAGIPPPPPPPVGFEGAAFDRNTMTITAIKNPSTSIRADPAI